MVAVVSLVAVECLTSVLLDLGLRRSVLRRRSLVGVVLVPEAAEPSAMVVLWLLALRGVVVVVGTLRGHPPSAVHGPQTLTAAAAVLDARIGEKEEDEERDDNGRENPAAVVVPARGAAAAVDYGVSTGAAVAIAVAMEESVSGNLGFRLGLRRRTTDCLGVGCQLTTAWTRARRLSR